MLDYARCRDNAPEFVQEAGGVLLSLWHFGAGELDLEIVARIAADRDRYREALRDVVGARYGPGLDGALDQAERVVGMASKDEPRA